MNTTLTFALNEWIPDQSRPAIAVVVHTRIAQSSISARVWYARVGWGVTTSDGVGTSDEAWFAGTAVVSTDDVTFCVGSTWRWIARVGQRPARFLGWSTNIFW